MAAVLELKLKKRGREKINSTKEKSKVTHRRTFPFSLLMKRRTTAPNIGKKTNSVRMGMPKMVMKPAPFFLIPPHLPLKKGGITSPFVKGGLRGILIENPSHDIIND
jgi:hypothetical protein